jgi:DNA-binding protein HU-beta
VGTQSHTRAAIGVRLAAKFATVAVLNPRERRGHAFSSLIVAAGKHIIGENACESSATVIRSDGHNRQRGAHMASASVSAGKTAMPVTTVTLKGIVEQLADGHDLPKKQANALLSGMIETMTTHLKSGDRIRISGIGTLEVRQREARTGRNPATGEIIQIAASKKVAFRPAKELKEAV